MITFVRLLFGASRKTRYNYVCRPPPPKKVMITCVRLPLWGVSQNAFFPPPPVTITFVRLPFRAHRKARYSYVWLGRPRPIKRNAYFLPSTRTHTHNKATKHNNDKDRQPHTNQSKPPKQWQFNKKRKHKHFKERSQIQGKLNTEREGYKEGERHRTKPVCPKVGLCQALGVLTWRLRSSADARADGHCTCDQICSKCNVDVCPGPLLPCLNR